MSERTLRLPAGEWHPWLIVLAGLAIMFVPTGIDLFRGLWSSDSQSHGPIVLGIGCWLIWRKWEEAFSPEIRAPHPLAGWACIGFAALCYVIGRSQGILIMEMGALIGMVAGFTLLAGGWPSLRKMLFPLFFLLFMLPLPSAIVDALTLPMKIAVSHVAESILYSVGYPVARSGVILQIGQYKLLVADACAGLHTLFTLEALGLLYLNLVRHPSLFRNIALAILIVPISFSANTIRVMVLTLITYHLGDEAGQGFLHGFAGMVLFMSALMLIIAVDSMLRFGERRFKGGRKAAVTDANVSPGKRLETAKQGAGQ